MKVFTNFSEQFQNQDNLLPLSMGITLGILLVFFLIAQILGINTLEDDPEMLSEMEVRELIKLEFAPRVTKQEVVRGSRQFNQRTHEDANFVKSNDTPSQANQVFASLVEGFDKERLISNRKTVGKRGTIQKAHLTTAGISTQNSSSIQSVADFSLEESRQSFSASQVVGRRTVSGGNQSNQIGVGGRSAIGRGVGSEGLTSGGLGLAGKGTGRATRGIGEGAGSAKISMPSGSGSSNAALDLHALIKWMKAHPGKIPTLVAHDMGHRSGDLSSAVTFQMGGKNFRLFLSCNEIEMLLRICLVEGNEFTLLKDNGIKESSNFLILGNVVYERSQIRSLISSRKEPAGKAESFYKIFWSWWLNQK